MRRRLLPVRSGCDVPRTLRDLLLDAHALQSDLRDAGLFASAGYMEPVIDAIRNRQAYDESERGNDSDTDKPPRVLGGDHGN